MKVDQHQDVSYMFDGPTAVTPIVRKARGIKEKFPISKIKAGGKPLYIHGITSTQKVSPEIQKAKRLLGHASFTARVVHDEELRPVGVRIWRDKITIENKRPRQ